MINYKNYWRILISPDKFFMADDLSVRVMNYGCGNRKEANQIGVDVSSRSDADHVISPEEDLPFENDYFDLVISRYVLEHVADLDHLLSEIHRVLRPNGVFRFCVPHALSIDMYDDPTHCRFFTLRTMNYYTAKDASNVCYSSINYLYAKPYLRLTLGWPKLRIIRYPMNFILGFIGLFMPSLGENLLKLPFTVGTVFYELRKPI